ncbi:hypothetical protein [Thiocystis violacea]|uniref:hypothetical protein n=1 Tax=Thiocystis violacea TaxID=13725 RepID=UPI001904FBAF|nr:hypothetical protein [Thiocystis violacea]MBK1716846.1 hypothetical protein [Thiocystis violacea]
MKLYDSDAKIRRLAREDGVEQALREARAQPCVTTIAVGRRIYIVHTQPGDAGLSCIEMRSPLDLPAVMARLGSVVGPIQRARVAPTEHRGRRCRAD